jgi:hypothetical protein
MNFPMAVGAKYQAALGFCQAPDFRLFKSEKPDSLKPACSPGFARVAPTGRVRIGLESVFPLPAVETSSGYLLAREQGRGGEIAFSGPILCHPPPQKNCE